MKSILYVGATLMIGASIYGFVDYKKTSQKDEFTSLYDETKKPVPVVTDDPVTPVVAKDEPTDSKTATVAEKKTKTATTKAVVKKSKKKKKLDHRIFSRAPLREEIEEKVPPALPVEKKKTEEKEQE